MWSNIEIGAVDMDTDSSIENEQLLIKAFMNMAIQANTEQLPILHPSYHDGASQRLKSKSKLLLQTARSERTKWYFYLGFIC